VTCDFVNEDAAYVLGVLSPAERAAFAEHLPGCVGCSDAVRDLAGLPGLLTRVPPDVFEAAQSTEPVPPTLLPDLVRRARRERRRRTWVALGAAAAAVAAVSGGAVAITHALDDAESAPTAQAVDPGKPMVALDSGSMTAKVAVTPVAWGTRLDLVCRYRSHDESSTSTGPDYAMFVRTRSGQVQKVASWRALPGRTMHLSAATADDAADIALVEIRSADGTPVLWLPS
jgi:hypothetical protein